MQTAQEHLQEHIDDIFARIKARGLSHITTAYVDHTGKLRSKYLHVHSLHKALTEGTALNLGIFSVAVNEQQMQNSVFLAAENEFRDGVLQLDAASCRNFPLDADGKGLLLLGELVDEYRAYCCRALLQSELQRYQDMGLLPTGAYEFEWYLLQETLASVREKTAGQIKAADGLESFYSFTEQLAANDLFTEIRSVCEAMNIALESLHNEFSTLIEAALLPAEGVLIADNAALFKAVIKAIARSYGLMASFMARRDHRTQGCGGHVNLNLLDAGSRRGLLYDKANPAGLTDTLLQFIGGLQKYTPELLLLQCPNLNSFRRFQPGLFAPLANNWGINNKTVAYRFVNTSETAARIEVRLPGADVNPYLSLAGLLIAGRQGIAEQRQPEAAVQGNGWSGDAPGRYPFPEDFSAAITAFKTSALARDCLGDAFVACYAASREWQLHDLKNTITDWEISTFIEGT